MFSLSGQPLHRSHASINGKRKWQKKDKEELLRRGQTGYWDSIGRYFKRTPNACYNRYVKLGGRDNNERRSWRAKDLRRWEANDDDELLRRGQSGGWNGIGKYFKRTPAACYKRYRRLMKNARG